LIFNTPTFALFAGVTIALYRLALPPHARPLFLIVAGCAFYAWAVPAYLLLVFALGALTYAALRALVRPDLVGPLRRALVVAAIGAILAVLFWFKYARFAAATIDAVTRGGLVPLPQIVVPLAISFFTFEFIHVLADAYTRKIVEVELVDFAVFALFFPTLVAGPIKRYRSFAPQVRAAHLQGDTALHLYRVALGLVKKTVLADSAGVLAAPLVHPGALYGTLDAWIGCLAYAAKIYFDFSGYSDIAIGVAGLLGFAVPENFDRPYRAGNIAAFWRRWHMSLSTWIRDYIFIPLGGSRRLPVVTALNLLVAMAVAGLWHGAAWTFVLWGLWHGAGLALHRAWSRAVVPRVALLRSGNPVVAALSGMTTFAFVTLGWVLFAASSLPDALAVYRSLF